MSIRCLSILILITSALLLSCNAIDTEYKWASTIPIYYVPLSSINSEDELNYYLDNDNIVIFYIDKKYNIERKDWILDKLLNKFNISRIVPEKIHGYEEYPVNNTLYVLNNKLMYNEKCIFEIKPKKILITYNIDPDSKEIMDFVGYYVSKNNGTFAYINKVPPRYKHILITGVAVQKAVLDDKGDYIIDVAGRKLKVDWRDDGFINKKIKHLKTLSKLLNINITYISTGDELLDVIEKSDIDKDELEDLLNDYWFKKRFNNTYFHTYVSSSDKGYYTRTLDILSMGYYPNIYVYKTSETFKNDPIGGFYPETVSYVGTVKIGYWRKEITSENEYYDYIKDEPSTDKNGGISIWYYQGEPVPLTLDSKLNEDRYKYFNHWFVKNYGNALAKGVNGLLLPSNNSYLLDAILGKDNRELKWKLNIGNKVEYIVIPGKGEPTIENNITIFKVPGVFEDLYGVPFIEECYIPPEGEMPGVYIGDIAEYNYSILYHWKDNCTWICSFRDYARWINNYVKCDIYIRNNSIVLQSNIPMKVTVYSKNVVYPENVSVEEYNNKLNKVVLYLSGGSYRIK
ncbi:hypothetical protein [Methanofervidicoccus abyssi]|uniref:Uncharacterized protein n=1 Tax=Methanofervidicoccus abyssi TaxID=2082189 RepID=A0A401HP21_9EURY|nr:hypothetical protein [Methanofervidicoccus abyssi]GBF35945.1 hypothetical protein MHHB_P0170 [Methanofervidicoccus abyssi]